MASLVRVRKSVKLAAKAVSSFGAFCAGTGWSATFGSLHAAGYNHLARVSTFFGQLAEKAAGDGGAF